MLSNHTLYCTKGNKSYTIRALTVLATNMLSSQDFQNAYKQIAGKLTNYLVAGGTEYGVACDIVQESFMRLWKQREKLTEEDSLSGMVYTIARNLRIDYARRNKRVSYQDELKDDDLTESGVGEQSTQDERARLRRRLQRALAELPADLREAYTLFQISEMSIKEIAKQCGISESLVKVRIYRAKQKLQESLQDIRNDY